MGNVNKPLGSICSINCGSEQGSGFLIEPEIIVTARHVIAPYYLEGASIRVKFESEPTTIDCEVCSIVDAGETPIALLKLPKAKDFYFNVISNIEIKSDLNFYAYGFFPSNLDFADKIDLQYVRDFSDIQEYNISFKPISERKKIFNGFSGAPVFVNGDIVGILTEQNKDNCEATRVFGICGSKFRTLLIEYGIKINIHKPTIYKQQTMISSMVELPALSIVDIHEIDDVFNWFFEQIRLERELGRTIQSQKELKNFLYNLKDKPCSEEKKAEFYYIGAIWMLLDENEETAKNYYEEAKRINPNIDDAVYRAYLFLIQGSIEQAKNCIIPINSIMKLNAYVACLVSEKGMLPEIQAVIQATGISENMQTYRLLALAALNSGCFNDGLVYIEKVRSFGGNIADISIIKALLYYWQVMSNIYPDEDRASFAFVPNVYFSFNTEQLEYLQKAYDILEEQYQFEKSNKDKKVLGTLTWGLVIISTLLPDKDSIYWLECFREYCYVHPLDILYCLNHKISISDEMCEEFLALRINKENGYLHATAKFDLLLFMEKYDEAKAFFAEYKEIIAKGRSISVDECELQLMIECKEYSEAERFLVNIKLADDDKNRYSIYILSRKKNKTYKNLVKQSLTLAKKTGLRIDFWNASIICRQYNKWTEAISNAKEWWKKTNELTALEVWIEALYAKKDYNKCLQVINNAETKGGTSEHIKQYKLNVLLNLARNEDALKLAQSFERAADNAKLVILQAHLYLSEGKPEKAIQILRLYADKDFYDLELYQMLIELIKADNPDLAYSYANKLYLHKPEDEQIIMYVGTLALMTGQEDFNLMSKFYMLIQNQSNNNLGFRMVSFNEIQELRKKQNEINKTLIDEYIKVKFPIHAFADSKNRPLSDIIFSIWNKRLPYSGRYGITKEVCVNRKKPLFLDYTSCLLLCKLGLFDTVCSCFSDVLLDSYIFKIWLNEINQLKDVQKHIVEQDISLSDMLKEVSFNNNKSDITKIESEDYDVTDCVTLNCAKNNNAFIIEEKPSGSITGKNIPDDWWSIDIQPCNLYALLDSLDLMHPDYDKSQVNREKLKKIRPHSNIVLSQQVLLELLETNSLKNVFDLFNVILPSEFVDLIHEKAEDHRNKAITAKWLEDSYNDVVNLYEKKKLKLVMEYNDRKFDNDIYLQLVCDEFNYISKNSVNFIIDDRFCSSYHLIGKKKPSIIVTTYDLITYMYLEKIIDKNRYFYFIDTLLAIGYSYFVPTADYLFSRLLLTDCNSDGVLEETDKLRAIRKHFAFTFDKDCGLQTEQIGTCSVPEIIGFVLEQRKVFNECLLQIWAANKPYSWRKAAANWLLAFVGDFLCDIEGKKDGNNKENLFVVKQAYLLLNILIISKRKTKYEYINWIEPFILVSWQTNPDVIKKVAKYITECINNFIVKQDSLTDEMKKNMSFFIVDFLNLLPTALVDKILEEPQFAVYKQYFTDMQDEPIFLGLEDYLKEQATFDKNAMLNGDYEALEKAVIFVISDWQKNCDIVINSFSVEDMYEVKQEYNYVFSQYFAEFAWYFPIPQSAHFHELKRVLSCLL